MIIGLVALTSTVSCTKEDRNADRNVMDASIAGEWQLTEIKAEGIVISEGLESYLAINADGRFELYQKSGTQTIRFDKFTGTCSYQEGLLSGTYSDGEPWASRYRVTFEEDTLVLTSYNLLEIKKYEKTSIPEDVKENANTITKSGDILCIPIL